MDWNEVKNAESAEELKNAKLWLFKESIRIQNEKAELEDSRVETPKEEENDDKHFGHTTDINLLFNPSIRLGWRF